MNDLVQRTDALPASFGENLMRGIADTRSNIMIGDGGKLLLRLLKSGAWVYGQNNEPVEDGSEWAVNIASLARGWVCWDDGELMGQVMASVQHERLPQPAPINGAPFVEQFSMELTCISEDSAGITVIYKNNSYGFKKAFEVLLGEIQNRWTNDKVFFWPVVQMNQESYDHKKYGTIYNPLLPVTGWTDENGEFSPDSLSDPEPPPPRTVPRPVPPKPAPAKPTPPAPPPEPEPPPVARRRGRPALVAAAPPAEAAPQPTQQTHIGQRRRPAAR